MYRKVFKGTVWLFLGRCLQQVLAYAKWIILARLLHPRDFGVFGFAILTMELLNTFTQSGFQNALIQKKEDTRHYLNSVWTFGIFRGFILFAVLWAAAPPVAHFFEGSWQWNSRDVLKSEQFLETLRMQETPLSEYIKAHLSHPGLLKPPPRESLKDAVVEQLVSDMNALCRQQDLQDPLLYTGVRLSAYAQKLLTEKLEGENLYRANRLLLEDAYSSFLQRKILNQPELILVIRFVGILIFLGAFGNVCTLFFQKDMEFHKQFLMHTVSSCLSIGLTIGLALFYRNVWPLVWGYAAGTISSLVLGYCLHPYKPRIELDTKKIRQLWGFGRWITLSGVLTYFLTHGDDLFVGKMLGAAALGFYLMAYKISNLPTTEITAILMNVMFPAYSKIQDDLPRLRAAYMKMISLIIVLTFLFSGLIALFAADFVTFCMGQRWKPIVSCIQVLALWGCVRPLGATSGAVFMSRGYPSYVTGLHFFKLFFLALLIYPLTLHYGFTGTGLSVLVSALFVQVPAVLCLKKVLQCSIRRLLFPVWAPLGGVTGMALVVILLRRVVLHESSWAVFIFLVFVALFAYLFIVWLIDLFIGKQLTALCREQVIVLWNALSKYV